MNTFQTMLGEKNRLNLRDIVRWKEDGKWSASYMLYINNDGKIGLLNMAVAASVSIEFDDIQKANEYFMNLKVDDNIIVVTDKDEWVVYTP